MVAVVAAFFTLMFAEQIFLGKFLLAGDPLYYSYPLRTVGWAMIRDGQLPLWTPHILSGYPLLSMSQLAFAYPLTWGYLFLPGHRAEQIYVLAPFLLAPAFTYAYARATGRSRPAALLAGLAFGYGGMMFSGISFTGLPSNSMLWLPLVLIPVDRAATGRGRFVPLLAGATAAYAMSVLNGQGQSFLYAGMAAAAYGLYLSLFPPNREPAGDPGGAPDGEAAPGGAVENGVGTAPKSGLRGWRRWRPLFVALGALLMSAGLAAFQILETMRAARRSIRSTLSYEAISAGAFTLREAAASLVLPLYYSTDVTAYVPPLALVFAALACVTALPARRGGARDSRVLFWFGVAVVGWILMLGPNTPAQQVVYRVPLLNKFRVPSRHAFEWTFAVSVLAAYGWDAAARRGWIAKPAVGLRERRAVVETVVASLLLALCLAVAVFWWRAVQVPALPGTFAYSGLPESTFLLWKLGFTLGVLLLVRRGARLAAPRARAGLLTAAIALACFVEPSLGLSRWFEGMLLTEGHFRAVSPTTRFLQNYPPEENRVYARVELYSEQFSTTPRLEAPNLTALHGIQNVAGYEPLILERYSRALGGVGMDASSPREGYARNDHIFQTRSHVLDVLNTTFVVSFPNLALRIQGYVHRDDITFFGEDMRVSLDPGETVALGGGAGAADTLALVTSLSSAGEVEQGAAVARVRVHLADAPAVERILRAGADTAEWAHARPDVRAAVRHAVAPVFDSRPGDAQNSFPAHRYLARFPLGARGRVDKIEITNLTARSPLGVWKASLYDSAAKISTPIAPIPPERWELVYQQNQTLILRNRRAMPRAWLVAEAEPVDGEEALRRLTGEGARDFDPRRTALLEVPPSELPALPGGEPPAGSSARIAEYEPNRLAVETRAEVATVLVVSEIFYPGWEATVDGVPARIHNTNFLLRGVFLPPGEHRVEMRYRPSAVRVGAIISAFTLACLCLLWVFDRRAEGRKRQA